MFRRAKYSQFLGQTWVGYPGDARFHFAAFPEPNGIRFGQNRNPFGSVENLLRVRDFTDVALVSEGETKNGAHKVILISASHRKIQ